MSVMYFAKLYQPVNKAVYTDTPATTFKIWTPATGNSVGITDISYNAAFTGTFRLFFSTTDITNPAIFVPIAEFIQAGSITVYPNFETPIMGTANQIVWGVGHTNGRLAVTLSGFEQD